MVLAGLEVSCPGECDPGNLNKWLTREDAINADKSINYTKLTKLGVEVQGPFPRENLLEKLKLEGTGLIADRWCISPVILAHQPNDALDIYRPSREDGERANITQMALEGVDNFITVALKKSEPL